MKRYELVNSSNKSYGSYGIMGKITNIRYKDGRLAQVGDVVETSRSNNITTYLDYIVETEDCGFFIMGLQMSSYAGRCRFGTTTNGTTYKLISKFYEKAPKNVGYQLSRVRVKVSN